jgi:hypothetical protein
MKQKSFLFNLVLCFLFGAAMILPQDQTDPVEITVTVENNFDGGGLAKVGVDVPPIQVNCPYTTKIKVGQTLNLEAIENQTPDGYTWIWNTTQSGKKSNWSKLFISVSNTPFVYTKATSVVVKKTDDGAIFVSNQTKICNLSFQGSLNGATAPAKISFNGTQYNLPATIQALYGSENTVQGVTQELNHISFALTSWSDGGALSKTINTSQHQSYTAVFKGTAIWSETERGIGHYAFISSDYGEYVKLNWNEHPNSNVAYKVVCDGTVGGRPYNYTKTINHGTTTYTDPILISVKDATLDNRVTYNVYPLYVPDNTINQSLTGSEVVLVEVCKQAAKNTNQNAVVTQYAVANYPNPFNPTTVVNYQVPQAGRVTLKVYDIMGREIATLVDENKEAGSYNVNFSMDKYRLSSGVYFCRMIAGKTMITNKMILSK